MKKLTLATLSTLALTLPCTNVFALDGTITVNGVVTDQTCVLLAGSIGSIGTNGLKDITVNIPALPKSRFIPNQLVWIESFYLFLNNATNTGPCDAATSKAFKGIHLSVALPDEDLDATDKTLLVNQASGASRANPVFMQVLTGYPNLPIDLSAPWGGQARSQVGRNTTNNQTYIIYSAGVFSKTGIVDAQNYTATVNYTMHYN